jgi:hypothetical protein
MNIKVGDVLYVKDNTHPAFGTSGTVVWVSNVSECVYYVWLDVYQVGVFYLHFVQLVEDFDVWLEELSHLLHPEERSENKL